MTNRTRLGRNKAASLHFGSECDWAYVMAQGPPSEWVIHRTPEYLFSGNCRYGRLEKKMPKFFI